MLDDASATFLAELAASGMPPLHELSPPEAREAGSRMVELYGRGPGMARVEDIELGPMRLRLLVPSERARGVIVYYHGGGWVLGSLDQFDALARRLAAGTGCAVVLVDYRLAPEHRYPTAVEDAWTACQWTAAQPRGDRGRLGAADRRRRQRRRVPRGGRGAAVSLGRPRDRAAGARVSGHRLRSRPRLLPRSRQPAAREPRHDGVVLGSLRARRFGALAPERVAAPCDKPRRPAAGGGAHGPVRRAARRGRGLRRAAGGARRPRRARALRRADARLLHDGRHPAGKCRRARLRRAGDRPRAPGPAARQARRDRRRRRLRRPVRAAPPAGPRPRRSRLRAGRGDRRHVVLEPLSGRPLRHRVDGLLLLVLGRARAGMGVDRAVSGAAGDPAVPQPRRRPLRPSPRHPAEHARRAGAICRRAQRLGGHDGGRDAVLGDLLHHGLRVPVVAAPPRDRRARRLRGRLVPHGALAARRGRARRQARWRDRHRLDRHPVDPAGRQAGRAPVRLPADGELQHARAQPAARSRGPARDQGRLPRAAAAVA